MNELFILASGLSRYHLNNCKGLKIPSNKLSISNLITGKTTSFKNKEFFMRLPSLFICLCLVSTPFFTAQAIGEVQEKKINSKNKITKNLFISMKSNINFRKIQV